MERVFEKRVENLRRKLKENDIDGYLVLYAPNRFYLTGFELFDPQCNESAGCVIVSEKDLWLCTDSRYEEIAKSILDEKSVFIYKKNRLKELREFIKSTGIKNLGFEAGVVTYELYDALRKEISLKPFVKGLVEELRKVKDEKEISAIKRAASLNRKLFETIEGIEVVKYKEKELAWEIEKFFKERDAQGLAFSPIVAAGPNSAIPHHRSSDKKIDKESILLIDSGCRVDDYCSDHTRTFWIGEKKSKKFLELLDIVKEAQQIALNHIKEGIKAKELYNMVVEFFEKYGLSKNFTHSLGHGVGLEVHEEPSLGIQGEEELKENMVITVEPGLYFPGWGGIRWEDMVIVKKDGAEVI